MLNLVCGFVLDTIQEVVDGNGRLSLWRCDPCNDRRDLDPRNAATRIVLGYYLQALELAQRTCCSQDHNSPTLPREFVSCLFRDSRFSTEVERFCVDMFQMLKAFRWKQKDILPTKKDTGVKIFGIH